MKLFMFYENNIVIVIIRSQDNCDNQCFRLQNSVSGSGKVSQVLVPSLQRPTVQDFAQGFCFMLVPFLFSRLRGNNSKV